MEENPTTFPKGTFRGLLAFALAIAFSSSGVVQRYLGIAGLVGFACLGVVALFVFARYQNRLPRFLTANARVLGVALLAILIGLFAAIYPIENSRGVGKSSDRDQGLNIAASRLNQGEFPYYENDDFAGPLSVLPGSIFFASPFVAAGNSAYQNFFWIAILMVFCGWYFGNGFLGVALTAACMFLSPSAMHEFVSGGDLLANGIFVAVLSMLALRAWIGSSPKRWWLAGSAFLMGCALASRPNFLFLLPVFCTLIWSQRGFLRALAGGSLVFGTTCLVILPFYFTNPEGFTPLIARAKIDIEGIPWASQAVIVLTLVASLGAAFQALARPPSQPQRTFAGWSAAIILCPMIGMVVLSSWAKGSPDFGFMNERFGVMYLPFLLIASGGLISAPKPRQPLAACNPASPISSQ